MVKLKPAKKYLRDFYLLPEQVEAYSETDMMMGVRFLQQYAIREKKPLVICVGLGTASGSRTGALPFADLLQEMKLITEHTHPVWRYQIQNPPK